MPGRRKSDKDNSPSNWVGSKYWTSQEYADPNAAEEMNAGNISWVFFEVFHGLIIA